MMKKILSLFIAVMFLLAACSAGQDKKEGSLEDPPELLEVSISTPEKIELNQEVTIEAKVTQGGKKVTDADEVKFEIWQSGQDEHEILPAQNKKNGIYAIKKTFNEGGNYFIAAHTTANRMHSMPKKEIVVAGSETEPSSFADGEKENHESHAEHEQIDHHNSEVEFEFLIPSKIKSNQPTELSTKIVQEQKLISEARVRFEIWQENETAHQFVDAKEISPGTYNTEYTFPSRGHFNVKIHVEKGNIHDHTEKSVDVE
ncbi:MULTISPECIES: FixH family protein [unclassified Mesobacillus]|uniref:FixH family protein n=1 Tax=unclassified Mesobacillus TaxID=2675270 RepID=UPI00203B90B5|nr:MULTISPECIES: FixH family protein [unclassified Mesobacillus]MCM3122978.1 FixH family protein [Mesobacillus sp. MER 33]MCM3233539.1 FixH family protein [Mesobacillus sp. MER 48]